MCLRFGGGTCHVTKASNDMKKSLRIAAFLFAFALTAAMGVLAVGCSSSDAGDAAANTAAATDEATDASADAGATAASGDIAAAEALIGQEMTIDEVEAALGPASNFEMSAEGCERGVMQGIFYYDGFSIYSRTYDKGNTFTIVSVSE